MDTSKINIISKILKVTKINSENSKTLEQKIIDVAEREKMIIKNDIFSDWSFLVYDYNRIHRFRSSAQAMGFEDTPVYGTLIAARAEQYVLNLLQEINNMDGRILNYEGHTINFKRPLYPGKRANWNLLDVKETEDGLDLNVSAVDSKGKVVISCPEVNLRLSRGRPESDRIISFSSDKVVERKKISIEQGELELFYKCLGKKPKQEIPMMYPAAFIPAALLDLLSGKKGKPEGGYLGLELEFYNQPNLGVFETIITMPSNPTQRRNMYHYTFEALCLQEGKPIFRGKVRCYSPDEFRL